jgi:hypothetical protein
VPAHPPVSTRPQVLPFGEPTWENFERLCHRLIEGRLWDCLAPHLSASAAVRRDFLSFIDRTDTTPGL